MERISGTGPAEPLSEELQRLLNERDARRAEWEMLRQAFERQLEEVRRLRTVSAGLRRALRQLRGGECLEPNILPRRVRMKEWMSSDSDA